MAEVWCRAPRMRSFYTPCTTLCLCPSPNAYRFAAFASTCAITRSKFPPHSAMMSFSL